MRDTFDTVLALFILLSVLGLGVFVAARHAGSSAADTSVEVARDMEGLLEAIKQVESSGRPDAVGTDSELGILQITPIMVAEVNRILDLRGLQREHFTLDDRLSVRDSEAMFWIYTDFWCDQTHDYSLEGIARRWNGGPEGHRKPSTEAYWRRVSAQMPEVGGTSSGN